MLNQPFVCVPLVLREATEPPAHGGVLVKNGEADLRLLGGEIQEICHGQNLKAPRTLIRPGRWRQCVYGKSLRGCFDRISPLDVGVSLATGLRDQPHHSPHQSGIPLRTIKSNSCEVNLSIPTAHRVGPSLPQCHQIRPRIHFEAQVSLFPLQFYFDAPVRSY